MSGRTGRISNDDDEAISGYALGSENGPRGARVIGRVPEIHPVSDLARNARKLIERARQRHEPIVITQRGRHTAVLVPIEVYRDIERMIVPQIASPRLVDPEDAKRFRMEMTIVDKPRR